MHASKALERVVVTQGDTQVASQVGLHPLGNLADRCGLSSAYPPAVPWTGERAPGQDRGRLFAQVAVMLAGGGQCVADMAALRDQPELFGDVASSPTIWRALQQVDDSVLDGLRRARGRLGPRCGRPSILPARPSSTSTPPWSRSTRPTRSRRRATTRAAMASIPCSASTTPARRALAGMLRPGNARPTTGLISWPWSNAAIASLPEARRVGHRVGDDPASAGHRIAVCRCTTGCVARGTARHVVRSTR